MVKEGFLFGNELITELESLIKESKNHLLLISPFIDLSPRIQDALRQKMDKNNFELKVLFGKNENNIYKSVKQDSFDFLKQFPNCEIRYNPRLHAKFYMNDYHWIVSSINLYDYSLSNNIEVGIQYNHSAKGLIANTLDKGAQKIGEGFSNLKQNLLGSDKEVDPIIEFERIFKDSDLMYSTEPIFESKGGLTGAFGAKKISGKKVIVDNLIIEKGTNTDQSIGFKPKKSESESVSDSTSNAKKLSASKIAAKYGSNVSNRDIQNLMESSGYISGETITKKGTEAGIVMKNYMGNEYIAYPENLKEFEKLT